MNIKDLKHIESQAQMVKQDIRNEWTLKTYRFIILLIVVSIFVYADITYINHNERSIMFQIFFILALDFTFCLCAGIPLDEYQRVGSLVSGEYVKLFFKLLLTWLGYYIMLIAICLLFGLEQFLEDPSLGVSKIFGGEEKFHDFNIVLVIIASILTLGTYLSGYTSQETTEVDTTYKKFNMSEEGMRLLKRAKKLPLDMSKMEGGDIVKWILRKK